MTPQKDGASPTELLKPHQICYGQNQPTKAPPDPGSSGECFRQRLASCHTCELALTTRMRWIHHSSLTRCGERAELIDCNLLSFPS